MVRTRRNMNCWVLILLGMFSIVSLAAPVQSLIGAKNNFIGNQSSSEMPYDAEVEWIATDGNAYIEVGEIPAGIGDGSMEIEYYIDGYTGYRNVWGCGKYGSLQICSYFNSGIKYLVIACSGQTKDFNNTHAPYIWYSQKVTTVNSKTQIECYSNDVLVATKDFGYPRAGVYKLFNCDRVQSNISTLPKPMPKLRIRKFQTSGCYGERDFIPVRIGKIGYMYDKANPMIGPLNNGLYGNVTNGVFIPGPDVK